MLNCIRIWLKIIYCILLHVGKHACDALKSSLHKFTVDFGPNHVFNKLLIFLGSEMSPTTFLHIQTNTHLEREKDNKQTSEPQIYLWAPSMSFESDEHLIQLKSLYCPRQDLTTLHSDSQLHNTLYHDGDRLCAALSMYLLSLSFKIKILMTVGNNSCSYELRRYANHKRQFIMTASFQLKTIQLNI